MPQPISLSSMKAFILHYEEEYIKENMRNPNYYFPYLKKHGVITDKQHQEMRQIANIELRIAKLIKVVSLHFKGFDLFLRLCRLHRPDNHISSYLKRRLNETMSLSSSGAELAGNCIESSNTAKCYLTVG